MALRAKRVRLMPNADATIANLGRSNSNEARSILRRIQSYRDVLLADALHGEVVKKDRMPKDLKERYSLTNLYVEDLPSFWRLLYTVTRDGRDVMVTVLEIVNHADYSNWFPGRRR